MIASSTWPAGTSGVAGPNCRWYWRNFSRVRCVAWTTLGDGQAPEYSGVPDHAVPPPYFVERAMVYDPPPADHVRIVLAHLAALGVGFGACHT